MDENQNVIRIQSCYWLDESTIMPNRIASLNQWLADWQRL